MDAFKHILVPTDFGSASNRAVDHALSLARSFDSKITLLHAYTVPPPGGYGEGLLWPVDELSKAAKRELDAAVAKATTRYSKVEGVLVSGEPWQQILKIASASQADLIVMGTHGRRGFSRLLLGSVAEKVVRLAHIPVLTVSSKEEEQTKKAELEKDAAKSSGKTG